MKKRGVALVLALLLLAGCAPEAEMPPPPSTSAETEPCVVYTDWSKLTPYVPEDRESLYTRRYESFTDRLIPAGDHGQLLPYRGARLDRRNADEWGFSGGQELWGLCNAEGELITDPVFHSVYQAGWWDYDTDGRGTLPLLILGAVREENGEWANRYALADDQGRWVTEFRYQYCSAVGPHGIVALEDTGECVLISPEGEVVWRTPGKEAWFWDNFWSGDTAILWDGEDTRLMDTHTGQSCGLDGARDPQGFHEGLARAHDEADKWGYIDGAGRWVIPPAYDQCGDFENGRAVAVREGTHSLIDRQGRTLLDAAWQLRACRGLDGENWYLDYVETEDYGCQVWAAYDEDGNQLDAPAEGTVLRVGIYGRMYETREDATVLWLGGAPVVLPLAGELEDVAAGYVVLANAEGTDCALLTLEGEVVAPFGSIGRLYSSTDELTGQPYFWKSTDENPGEVLLLDEDGRVLVTSGALYGGLLQTGRYSEDCYGYLRPDGAWVFRYVRKGDGNI